MRQPPKENSFMVTHTCHQTLLLTLKLSDEVFLKSYRGCFSKSKSNTPPPESLLLTSGSLTSHLAAVMCRCTVVHCDIAVGGVVSEHMLFIVLLQVLCDVL